MIFLNYWHGKATLICIYLIFFSGKCVGDCIGCCGTLKLAGITGGYMSQFNGEYSIQNDLQFDRNYFKFEKQLDLGKGPEDVFLYWTGNGDYWRWMVNIYLRLIKYEALNTR